MASLAARGWIRQQELVFFFFTWLVRAPVSGSVGDVGIKLPIRVAPHRRGLGTALYQLLLAEILLVPHSHVTWVHIALCQWGFAPLVL